MNQQRNLTPVDPKGVPRANVPYFIEMEPPAQVAAGATVVVRFTIGPRNFKCTGFGFTSQNVGFPLAGQLFRLGIVDIGASIRFQPHRWHATPITGSVPGVDDRPYVDFPGKVEWTFAAQTTVEVEFENIGALACTPTLVLAGYLE